METRGMKTNQSRHGMRIQRWETEEGRWTEVRLVLTPSECGQNSTATGWKHAPLKSNEKMLSIPPSLLLSFVASVSPSDPPSSSHSLISFFLSICYSLQHRFGHMSTVSCKSDKRLDGLKLIQPQWDFDLLHLWGFVFMSHRWPFWEVFEHIQTKILNSHT